MLNVSWWSWNGDKNYTHFKKVFQLQLTNIIHFFRAENLFVLRMFLRLF